MKTHPISPKAHALSDYALVAGLLILPTLFKFSKPVKKLYAVEGATLLTYVALTQHPATLKPLIPFRIHGKIDPFNIGQFALQSFFKPLRKDKKALAFNLLFTAIAGMVVALTDWNGRTE